MTKPHTPKYLSDLHHDHMMWLNTLQFRKEETTILEHRLKEIAARNTKQEVTAEVEHFQNNFIRQRELIDELRHEINAHESELEHEMMMKPVSVEHRYFLDHGKLRQRIKTFEKLYMELKNDFYGWVGKWL